MRIQYLKFMVQPRASWILIGLVRFAHIQNNICAGLSWPFFISSIKAEHQIMTHTIANPLQIQKLLQVLHAFFTKPLLFTVDTQFVNLNSFHHNLDCCIPLSCNCHLSIYFTYLSLFIRKKYLLHRIEEGCQYLTEIILVTKNFRLK